MTKVKLLIANDDGISAPGLQSLLEGLANHSNKYDIRVGAPESERSGTAHAFSFNCTTKTTKNGTYFKLPVNVPAYTVSGFPSDIITLAFKFNIFGDDWIPDIVVSGINRGVNGGLLTYTSGTVAAAREAVIHGAKSISISLDDFKAYENEDYKLAVEYILPLIDWLSEEQNWPKLTILNVNLPLMNLKNRSVVKYDKVRGIIVTKPSQGLHRYTYKLQKCEKDANSDVEIKEFSPKIAMLYNDDTVELHDDDMMAVNSGYIALTPLALHSNELLDSALVCLKKWESQLKHPKLPWFHSKL